MPEAGALNKKVTFGFVLLKVMFIASELTIVVIKLIITFALSNPYVL